MKRLLIILLQLMQALFAQELPPANIEQQIEEMTEIMEDAELNDDSWLQQTQWLTQHKLDINVATEAVLQELQLLTQLQIAALIRYRKLLGKFVSIYEIQAIPHWDLPTIEKVLPYITVKTNEAIRESLQKRFSQGTNRLIVRYGQVLQKAKGYRITDNTRSSYAGDPSRIMFRYKYQYKNLLQYGITGAKDAGEPFFKPPNKYGFDFYSVHLFSRHKGFIRNIAIGDYTINIGQGLIHWQAMAFGKSATTMNIKRQAAILRPYNAPGSYYFNRGFATTLQKNNWQSTLFVSLRHLDGKLNTNENDETIISSIHVSGYHRTPNEINDKTAFRQLSYGSSISYNTGTWKLGLNSVFYQFDNPLQKDNNPYNFYAINGSRWRNYSIDYNYSFKNVYLFGETAWDKNGNIATINSLLTSLHPSLDFSVLYRHISKAYQAVNGNAFTVATNPNNETGIYAGITIKPRSAILLSAYIDMYQFAWLKYRVDAPSKGKDYLLQLQYKPRKTADMYTRLRVNNRPINDNISLNPIHPITQYNNYSWRTQINYQLNKTVLIRHRFELLWYHREQATTERGFLAFADFFYKPRGKRYDFNCRLQYFDSDSYNSRLYAYENDVLYYYAVPVFYNKGSRFYFNTQYNINKQLAVWLKLAHTIYDNQTTIGSGLEEIDGNQRTEMRFLLSYTF